MAINVPQRVYSDGTSNRFVLYRFFGLNAGDTFNVSGEFSKVIAAYLISTTAVLPSAPPISANTVLTPAGAFALDDGYLMVYGAGLQQ